jgi:heptaprenyl diphosphate synthase
LNKNVRKLTTLALILALGLVLSAIEMLIPMNFLPGVKIGLGNIATIIAIVMYGFFEGLFIAVVRTVVVLLLGGSAMSFALALSGGILATVVMFLLFKLFKRSLSIIGISVAGSVAHNIGQISAVMVIAHSFAAVAYLPVLLFSGVIMGAVTGFSAQQIMRLLPKKEMNRSVTK